MVKIWTYFLLWYFGQDGVLKVWVSRELDARKRGGWGGGKWWARQKHCNATLGEGSVSLMEWDTTDSFWKIPSSTRTHGSSSSSSIPPISLFSSIPFPTTPPTPFPTPTPTPTPSLPLPFLLLIIIAATVPSSSSFLFHYVSKSK